MEQGRLALAPHQLLPADGKPTAGWRLCNEALHRNLRDMIKLFADAEFPECVTLVQQWQFARHEFITNS